MFGNQVPDDKRQLLASIDGAAAPEAEAIATEHGFRYLGLMNRYLVFEHLDRTAITREEAKAFANELYDELTQTALTSKAVERLISESEGLRIT